MIFKKPFFLALCLNAIFFLLYLAFGRIQHGSLDDYFMSSVLTGAYGGEYDVHMYFVNSAYGYFLKPFYWLFPKVGWYFIFELLGTFAAFTTYTYVLIKKMGLRYGVPLSLLLLASFTPDFYFQLSFTQCATSYTAAGLLLLFLGASEDKKGFLALGGLFLVAGNVMRHGGFLLGMPYLVLLLIVLWRTKKLFSKKLFITLILVFAAIYGLRMYDRSLFSEGDYKYYAAYQPVRSYFGDGEFYDRESTYDELEERGMSGPDFYLLKSWMFYDTDVFAIDSLKKIIQVSQNNLYTPNLLRMPVTFFLAVSKALTRCNGWCWAIFCLILMLMRSKKSNLYPWFSLIVIAVSIGYLLLVNRLVYHVESGVWLYAAVCSIVFMSLDLFWQNAILQKWMRFMPIILCVFAIFFACFAMTDQFIVKNKKNLIETAHIPVNWQQFLNYAENHVDDVFLLSFSSYKTLGSFKNPPYLAIRRGSWQNIFSWGYWNIHLPSMKQEFLKRGVTNPIKDIVHDNVYLIEDYNTPSLCAFYEDHYHQKIKADTVKVFVDLMLLKYRYVNDLDDAGRK